jgi:hypothetical protein
VTLRFTEPPTNARSISSPLVPVSRDNKDRDENASSTGATGSGILISSPRRRSPDFGKGAMDMRPLLRHRLHAGSSDEIASDVILTGIWRKGISTGPNSVINCRGSKDRDEMRPRLNLLL